MGRMEKGNHGLNQPPTYSRDILHGIRDGLLFIPLYLPLAVPYAVLARKIGLSPFEAVLWSALIYAGSAQLACMTALTAGAGLLELMVITFMANVRHSFVAMSITTYLRAFRGWTLVLFSFTIATPSAGLIPVRARKGGDLKAYGLANQICQWFQWVLFTLMSVWLESLIPVSWERVFSFAVPAAYLGLTSSMVRENLRPGIVVAAVAAALSLVFCLLTTPHLSIIAAALIGAGAGLLVREEGVPNAQ